MFELLVPCQLHELDDGDGNEKTMAENQKSK